ncbi:MAG: PspC domain-containing protein [Tidjanibacter sp.]|nr:PspC domain-containing protein [Tidjanibacter sp.]
MKAEKKLSVKIGSTAFSIDEDAYRALENYLNDIAARLDEAAKEEVLGDLEMRIADLLSSWLGTPEGVVDIYLVRKVQEQIGRPEEFGELREPKERSSVEELPKRLLRTSEDKVIGGVCGGIAKFTRIDPTLLRIATLLLIFFGGLSLWIYIILWIFIPLDTKVLNN